MTHSEITLTFLQRNQPWNVPYSQGVLKAGHENIPYIFAIHTVLHLTKSIGKLSAIFEKLDHTTFEELIANHDWPDMFDTLKNMSADLVTGAIRLANLYQFDLVNVLVERIKEKNGVDILTLTGQLKNPVVSTKELKDTLDKLYEPDIGGSD